MISFLYALWWLETLAVGLLFSAVAIGWLFGVKASRWRALPKLGVALPSTLPIPEKSSAD